MRLQFGYLVGDTPTDNSRQINTPSVANSEESGEAGLVTAPLDGSIADAPKDGAISRRAIMNYIVSSAALAVAAIPALATAAENGSLAEPFSSPSGSAKSSENVAWVEAMRADGWIFSLKPMNYRGGQIVQSDPFELDDYALCRPSPGRTDDTERLIVAMRHHEQWRAFRAHQRSIDPSADPVFAAIDEFRSAACESLLATAQLDAAQFAARETLGRPASGDDAGWYDRAGLATLKSVSDAARDRYALTWGTLSKVAPTTTAGAAALIEFVLADVDEGNDFEETHAAMLRAALRTLPDPS